MMEVYLTTNKVNGKKYIGLTNGNNPSYLGSGVLIKQAIKKYGAENFVRETLVECETEELLREAEEFFIQELDAVASPDFYNLHEGGRGGDMTEFVDREKLSRGVEKMWAQYTPEEKQTRLGDLGKWDKSGSKNPRARKAIVNGKEYSHLKAALKDFPNVPYSTLKHHARTEKPSVKYGIEARYI